MAKIRHVAKTLGHYEIRGARAIDGDTIECIIHLPFDTLAIKRIRLAGFWAPEMDGLDPAAAIEARDLLQKFLTENVCTIFSRSERKDKYGRIIASLWASQKPVEPSSVLGLWQLTETDHRVQVDAKRKAQAAGLLGQGRPATGDPRADDWGNIAGADDYGR